MKDRDFLTACDKQDLEVNPVGAAQVNAMLDRVYATPKAVIDQVAKLLSKE
ncbi:MAG: hypothetical protein ACK4NA_08115 [Alphaproteobacteria bacterium]